jgi:hypothetical protein
MKTPIFDGLINVLSSLTNRRSATSANIVSHQRLGDSDLRAIYKSGIGAKICKIKAGYALNDTLQFKSKSDETYYHENLAPFALKASRFMVGFGRGLVVLYQTGDDLATPFVPDDTRRVKQRVFSGDLVSAMNVSMDFHAERYYKPETFNVRGTNIHWSRCVDFTYFEPPEHDAPHYKHGGISEFEMIYPQLVNDAVVERASGSIVEKNSTVFYKVKGFRSALEMGKDKDIIRYFSALEDNRSIYGAGIVDADDEAISLDQTLTNLAEVDNITLRRLAMVTGIPLAWLVGENVKGMNSTGDNERQIFQDMIETVQSEHLLVPINRLMKLHGRGVVEFKDNQGETPLGRIEYESKVIINAKTLWEIGEDHVSYLKEHDIVKVDVIDEFFEPVGDDETESDSVA